MPSHFDKYKAKAFVFTAVPMFCQILQLPSAWWMDACGSSRGCCKAGGGWVWEVTA